MVEVAFADAEEGIEGLFKLTQSPQALPPGFTPTGVCQMRALQDTMGRIVIILHPRPRDTGKFAALGPNIMSPKGCLLLRQRAIEPEARGPRAAVGSPRAT